MFSTVQLPDGAADCKSMKSFTVCPQGLQTWLGSSCLTANGYGPHLDFLMHPHFISLLNSGHVVFPVW